MPKVLTDEERTKRGQRRRVQRNRAALRKMAAKLIFYKPNILNGSGSQQCSVCGCDTLSHYLNFGNIALCSKRCMNSYADQWRHFGLDLSLGNRLIYKGQLYKFDTNMLVINSEGEVCIYAWNPNKGCTASGVLIPLSQSNEIVQLPC